MVRAGGRSSLSDGPRRTPQGSIVTVKGKLNPKEGGAQLEKQLNLLGLKGSEYHPHCSRSTPGLSGQGR